MESSHQISTGRIRPQSVAAFFVVTPNWDTGWNTHKTRKRGWHFLTRSTTSAWPKFFISFHFISFYFISFHFISFHFISFHFISFHFISFHFISFHFISFHFISFHFISFHFISFQRLASVTHGHGPQSLYWRCAKQKDRAKIFHCFKLENKASSRAAPPTTSVASLYTLDPQEFFWAPPALRMFNNPRPKSVTREHALPPDVSEGQSCNPSKKNQLAINENVGNFLAAASL